MKNAEQNTEELILQSARKVFKQKGFDGTTVQDIAEDAGTTKSMVNYYFRSKEKLFTSVFMGELKIFFSGIASFIQSDLPLKQKIEKIVELDTEKLLGVPELPVFILNEINRNGELVFKHMGDLNPGQIFSILREQVEAEAAKGVINKDRAEDLLLNIQALTIFPILAKPMMKKALGLSEEEYKEKLRARKKVIVEMVWTYITN